MPASSKSKSPVRSAAAESPAKLAPALPPVPEPDPFGPLRGIVRRWPVVLAVTVVLCGVALVAGYAQAPTYTANAVISVGRVDVRVQTLPGYVAGAQTLAAAYSRTVPTDPIVLPLARQLGIPPAEVRERLWAVPVPESTMFAVYGTGGSAAEATELTGAATSQFERYVKSTETSDRTIERLMTQFREQSRRSASYRRRIDELQAQIDRAAAAAATSTASESARRRAREERNDRIERLQTSLDTSELRKQVLVSQYNERMAESASSAGIQVVTRPVSAESDRRRTLERSLVIGLLAGLMLGGAAALLVDRRRR
ncbi:hypothetical protein DVA67_018435 [Solirubrobacter sp. CPCC 204708]|uniref:Polysaccharide chain length determinant N-terminal domain-containing protein n=1 Tax=Solirubrobacter deserti TaxID=2282478 RepID=A0ABT4RM83_9ACTN|nr:hypothetical protein [Solirubrobacter deserti]MBE2317965.1 hypothetical protein [Solirubrobacter deserti]MDA0139644.1 hypothetical protein [Solirubrobacter deserti]